MNATRKALALIAIAIVFIAKQNIVFGQQSSAWGTKGVQAAFGSTFGISRLVAWSAPINASHAQALDEKSLTNTQTTVASKTNQDKLYNDNNYKNSFSYNSGLYANSANYYTKRISSFKQSKMIAKASKFATGKYETDWRLVRSYALIGQSLNSTKNSIKIGGNNAAHSCAMQSINPEGIIKCEISARQVTHGYRPREDDSRKKESISSKNKGRDASREHEDSIGDMNHVTRSVSVLVKDEEFGSDRKNINKSFLHHKNEAASMGMHADRLHDLPQQR